MRLKSRDFIAIILVAAVAVPYLGYLLRGEMPFIQDARGMAATGLVLGVAAFLVVRSGDRLDRLGKAEIGIGAGSLVLGLVALVLAESAAAELLLALFMMSILVVLAVELMDHAGVLHGHQPARVSR